MERDAILLVEDNPNDVILMQRMLKKNGVTNKLVVARDGAEAVGYLFGEGAHTGRDRRIAPVLILLDLELPKIDGFEVLKRIRADENSSLIPLVILTSSKDDRDWVKKNDPGDHLLICKPVGFDHLAEAVRQLKLKWMVLNGLSPA